MTATKFTGTGKWPVAPKARMSASEIADQRDTCPSVFDATVAAAEMFMLQTRHYEEMAVKETNSELRAIYEALAEAGRRGDQIESFRLMQRMERFFFGDPNVPVGEVVDE